MQFLLDHLSSILVASSVLLLSLVARTDASQLALEQTAHYSARSQAQVFSQWVQKKDLNRIGENYGNGETSFEMPVQATSGNLAGMTERFEFSRDSLRKVGEVSLRYRVFTRYRLLYERSVTVRNEPFPIPLFRLERDEQIVEAPTDSVTPTAGGWQRAGGSSATLSQFRIVPTDRDGQPTTDVEETDFLQLRLSFVPPFDNVKRELHELHWGTTVGIRPF